MLRRIFATERGEVAGSCRILHSEELHNLHSLLIVMKMINSRGEGWLRHV
jgi:hypothetical protein